jgi:hypothetical protein
MDSDYREEGCIGVRVVNDTNIYEGGLIVMVSVMSQAMARGMSKQEERTKEKLHVYQKPAFAGKKLIYICSPLRPQSPDPDEADMELFENLFRARNACELVKNLGAIPVCPHLYFPQFLDDELPEERELGMQLALAALRRCHAVYVFSEHITPGMVREIAEAAKRDIPVKMLCEEDGTLEDVHVEVHDAEEED